MADPVRYCSECPNPLVNEDGSPKPPGTKTCSKRCRQMRSRRQKNERHQRAVNAASLPPGLAEASQVTSGKVKDAMHEVIKEELRPLVTREVMTDRVLAGVERMIGMTPDAIELLHQHMQSSDETIAQRAVTLLLKYTLGNPSVAPAPKDAQPGGLTVQFNIPRPGDAVEPEFVVGELVEDAHDPVPSEVTEGEEVRECLDCGETKPVSQMVGNAPKCKVCYGSLTSLLKDRFGGEYRSG